MPTDAPLRAAPAGYTPDSDRGDATTFAPRLRHYAAIASLAAIIAGGITFVLASMGFQRYGPAERIQAVNLRVDTLAARVDRNSTSISDMSNQLELQTYLTCVLVRRTDPTLALPDGCPTTVGARSTAPSSRHP